VALLEARCRCLANASLLPAVIRFANRIRGVDKADRIYRRCVARLFSGDFNAFDVLRWKDIVEAVESAVNGIEKLSGIVAAIAIKHA
jgi:uncharacterized protein Yka (UPF0111/DUF47 family)